MLERINPVLRILCLILAGLVIYQIFRLGARKDPLKNLNQVTTVSVAPAQTKPANKETNSSPRQPPGKKEADLPPLIQARVDKITQSEILGMVVRPLPMALLGIAGRDAFLRAPNGQTGLLREGEELGGVKLLQIGTNRVLVEHEQKKKELTVSSGLGSEPLLPKGERNPP